MQQISQQQRRRGMVWTDQQRKASEASMNLALSDPSQEGHDGLVDAYRRIGAERLAKCLGKPIDQMLHIWKSQEPRHA
jgi:hypothetical protein